MNLHEILTEKISGWEEGLIAALFLNSLTVDDLAIEPAAKKHIQLYLGVLSSLPWSYAKEICYAIASRNHVKS